MPTGLEMMAMNMFKSLGIDPAEIMAFVEALKQGAATIAAQQSAILSQQRTIIDQLEQLGAKPRLLPQSGDIDNDGEHGNGTDGSHRDSNDGTGAGNGVN